MQRTVRPTVRVDKSAIAARWHPSLLSFDDGRPARRRIVCRFDDGEQFAYVRGRELIRSSNHEIWAHVSGNVVRSARSGEPLAYAIGDVLYDCATRRPAFVVVDA